MRRLARTSRLLLLCGIAAWGALQATIALAEVTEADILKGIETARRSGARISDEEVQTILSSYREDVVRASRMKEELEWDAKNVAQDLEHPISHTKGREGIAFPSPAQVVFAPKPTEPAGSRAATTPVPVWSPAPYERPTACTKNETKRIEYDRKGEDSVTYVDRLFVREDLVPIDSGEVYGPKVDLIPYGPNESNATMVRMSIYRVPCVPYRMRMTGKAEYIDTGVNALKNYTSNPAGKGVLHPFVEEKLNPEKYHGKGPTRPQRR